MADNGSHPSTRHRHAQQPTPVERRRRAFLIAVSALAVAVITIVLAVLSGGGSGDAVAERSVAPTTVTVVRSPPIRPAATPAPTTSEAAPTPDVPSDFVDRMQQVGIPLDPHTAWVVAQGICVRLGQPEYDQFRLSEGVERLFPSVPDEKAHEFVAMVADTVCQQ